MKKWLKENKINLVLIIAWGIISFTMIFFHESWRDEAQSWLIARDLNLAELFSQLKYEGHFILWYLIIMPFAKLGFPYITQNIISWFICLIAVIIINLKSPLKLYQKVLFTFSLPLIYQYPVIARCYALIPLAISLIALFYKDRKEKPFRYILSIVLLANTHTLMLGMVGILLLEFYIDIFKTRKENSKAQNKKYILSFILTAVLLFITALPILNSLTSNQTIGSNRSGDDSSLSPLKILIQMYNMIITNYPIIYNVFIFKAIIIVAICVYIIFVAKEYTKSFIEFLIIFLWQLFIYVFIFSLGIFNQKSRYYNICINVFRMD